MATRRVPKTAATAKEKSRNIGLGERELLLSENISVIFQTVEKKLIINSS